MSCLTCRPDRWSFRVLSGDNKSSRIAMHSSFLIDYAIWCHNVRHCAAQFVYYASLSIRFDLIIPFPWMISAVNNRGNKIMLENFWKFFSSTHDWIVICEFVKLVKFMSWILRSFLLFLVIHKNYISVNNYFNNTSIMMSIFCIFYTHK